MENMSKRKQKRAIKGQKKTIKLTGNSSAHNIVNSWKEYDGLENAGMLLRILNNWIKPEKWFIHAQKSQ